jgi:hypothetical protein
MDHSNYSPSRLSRIIACPGSAELIENLMDTYIIQKSESSTYAAHGTMLHKVMDKYYICPNTYNENALDGLEIDDRVLIQDAAEYLDLVYKGIRHSHLVVKSEAEISLKSWGIPDVYGTLDYTIIDLVHRHAHIFDWKFGSGVTVYAKENPQLLAYAAGAIKWPTLIQNITIHIVQPAIDHYDTWECTINELYDWVHGTLAIALNKCHTLGIDQFIPGIDQCRWCEAKNHCRARLTHVQETAIKLFNAKEKLATCPTTEELVKLINKAPLVENAIKTIRLYLQKELERGHAVPGLKLVRGRANRKWKDEKEAITWLAKNTSVEELFTSKLRSPSQLEKEVRTLKKSEGFKKLYETPEGKITMVPESDGRPAIQTNSGAIDVFSKVT